MTDWSTALTARRTLLQGQLGECDQRIQVLEQELISVRARRAEVQRELGLLEQLSTGTAEPPPPPPPEETSPSAYRPQRIRILRELLEPEFGPLVPARTGGKKVYFRTEDSRAGFHLLMSKPHVKSGRFCGWFGIYNHIFDELRRQVSKYSLIFAVRGIDRVHRVPSEILLPLLMQSSPNAEGQWEMNLYLDPDELYVPPSQSLPLADFSVPMEGLWR